jgi:hypothetical protein
MPHRAARKEAWSAVCDFIAIASGIAGIVALMFILVATAVREQWSPTWFFAIAVVISLIWVWLATYSVAYREKMKEKANGQAGS